jgi:hypothetical protein
MDGFHRRGYSLSIRLWPAKIARQTLKKLIDLSARRGCFRFVIHRASRVLVIFGHTSLIGTL